MTQFNFGRSVALIAALLLLPVVIGCQGQNPFQPNSNPVKDYQTVVDQANQPYTDGKQAEQLPPPDNTQAVCDLPISAKIENDIGNHLVKFPVGIATSVNVHLDVPQTEYEISIEGLPKGAGMPVKNKSGKSLDYTLSWTPGAHVADTNTVTLTYRTSNTLCSSNRVRTVSLTMLATQTNLEMALTYVGLPTTIEYAAKQSVDGIPFQVEVMDPSATESKPPTLVKSKFQKWITTAEHPVKSGFDAVDCAVDTPIATDTVTRWRYNCTLFPAKVSDIGGLLNKEATAQFAFFYQASSNVSSTSTQIEASPKLNLHFVAPPAAAVTAPPAAVVTAAPASNTASTTPITLKVVDTPVATVATDALVICGSASTANAHTDMTTKFSTTFPVPKYTVVVKDTSVKAVDKKVSGKSHSFVLVKLPDSKAGWIASDLIKPKASCQGAK